MLPPTIPTSFVPHLASAAPNRPGSGSVGIFSFLSYFILAIVFVLAIGVFFYGRILSSSQMTKDAQLAQAEAEINPSTVESFVRLRDRLSTGKSMLANHTAFSGFFSALGMLMPSTVRFTSMHLSIDEKGVVRFDGSGVAKSFNALATASTAFARNGRIKDAIFSDIVVSNTDNSVSFALSAALDQKLVTFSP